MRLFNTLTRNVDELKTLEQNEVKLYTCGLTVYSHPHIGNWVGYIYWDVLHRTLEVSGYKVKHVQNITDVGHLVSDDDNGEDKMEKGARTENLTAWEIADKYIKIAEHEAYELLGLIQPQLVRATDYIPQQIEAVKNLEACGYTYIIDGEGVYFDTGKLEDYGKLAKLSVGGLHAGTRVAFKNKRNVTDFALWKFSPKDQKRDMEWESPWGKGFPGWHLECSVIAQSTLGEQIDIHTGGIDHIPIHHTNEIAQSEALTGKQFSQIWLHNNHLKVDGGKMAKSIGNIYTLKDIVDNNINLQAFKLMVLSKSYYTEGNFTWEILKSAQNRLHHWQQVTDLIWQSPESTNDISTQILNVLEDNLNTPEALKYIDQYFKEVQSNNKSPNKNSLMFIERILGISLKQKDMTKKQKELFTKRQQARDSKNWQKADELRNELEKLGIEIRDESTGQVWNHIK